MVSEDLSSMKQSDKDFNTLYSWVYVASNFKIIRLYNAQKPDNLKIFQQVVDMVEGLTLNEYVQQCINLLKEVMQQPIQLRERFKCVQSTRESIENQDYVDSDIIQQEIETSSTISDVLKANFATSVKCFKSAMDIIQVYLDPNITQPESIGDSTDGEENELNYSKNVSSQIYSGDFPSADKESKNNKNSDSSSERNDPDNDETNNDTEDEDSKNSCHEKDQDESIEIGRITSTADSGNNNMDQHTMKKLRIQTEIEQKEILRLLEEKRIMQQKLTDLKRAKEMTQNQMMNLGQNVNMYDDFSRFLRIYQDNELDNPNIRQHRLPKDLNL